MQVDRCLCSDKTFAQLKRIRDRFNLLSMEQLSERTGCCKGCNMCRPYVEQMMRTGETSFVFISANCRHT